MMDLLAQADQSISVNKLSDALGIPVVPVDGRTAWGMEELMATLRRVTEQPSDRSQRACRVA